MQFWKAAIINIFEFFSIGVGPKEACGMKKKISKRNVYFLDTFIVTTFLQYFSTFRELCKDVEWIKIIKNIVDTYVPVTNWADLNEDVKENLTHDTFEYFGCVSHHHGSISELRKCIKIYDE